jgi:type IV secretion system protein VirB11
MMTEALAKPESIEAQHVRLQLVPLARHLAGEGVYDVCVNAPGEVWVETGQGWQRTAEPELTFERLSHLARAVATLTRQKVSAEQPLLSASLPDGERLQIVLPPAVPEGRISVTIRKPSVQRFSVAQLASGGLFRDVARSGDGRSADAVREMFVSGAWAEMLSAAVRARKNIIISGATGSGKTTLLKALIGMIPMDERIITIEDTPELDVQHPNTVSLRYSKDGQGQATIGATELIAASLRMKPDRILMQEIRDGTAFDYIRNVNAGHPGSITTVHADSCALAFEQLGLLVKQSPAGSGLARDEIRRLLEGAVDVVVQCKRVRGQFRVSEIDHVAGRRAA